VRKLRNGLPDGDGRAAGSLSDSTAAEHLAHSSLNAVRRRFSLRVMTPRVDARPAVLGVRLPGADAVRPSMRVGIACWWLYSTP